MLVCWLCGNEFDALDPRPCLAAIDIDDGDGDGEILPPCCPDCWEQVSPTERLRLSDSLQTAIELRRVLRKFSAVLDKAIEGEGMDPLPPWARN